MVIHSEVDLSKLSIHSSTLADSEIYFVNQLVRSTLNTGKNADPITKINLYVSLKSKPLVILVGRENSGKRILIESITKMLTNSDPNQSLFMLGHAWWAERSENVALFTHAQSQLNEGNLLSIIEEARKPGNKEKAYIACLDRISPAEVVSHFSELSIQFQRREKWHKSVGNSSALNAYPPNFFSIGIMDTSQFSWYDEDLLSQTSIIYWQEGKDTSNNQHIIEPSLSVSNGKNELLSSCVRTVHAAYLKLMAIIRDQPNALLPLLEVERVMIEHGVDFSPRSVTNEAVIYLSNAWTNFGNGLFARSLSNNLDIALDLVISQTVLPRGWKAFCQSDKLRNSLRDVLSDKFSYSLNLLDRSVII